MIAPAVLDRCHVFRDAGPDARDVLLRRGVERRHPAGRVLWTAGSRAVGIVVLLEGRVRVLRGGRRAHVIHTEGPGATLGEIAAFDGGPMPATAVAETAIHAVVFDPAAVRSAVAADARLAATLLARLAERMRHLVERLDERAALDVTGRLARHLLRHDRGAGGAAFRLVGSQAALAEELGTVREVLVRALRRLRHRGIIASAGRGRLQVRDRAALAELAEVAR